MDDLSISEMAEEEKSADDGSNDGRDYGSPDERDGILDRSHEPQQLITSTAELVVQLSGTTGKLAHAVGHQLGELNHLSVMAERNNTTLEDLSARFDIESARVAAKVTDMTAQVDELKAHIVDLEGSVLLAQDAQTRPGLFEDLLLDLNRKVNDLQSGYDDLRLAVDAGNADLHTLIRSGFKRSDTAVQNTHAALVDLGNRLAAPAAAVAMAAAAPASVSPTVAAAASAVPPPDPAATSAGVPRDAITRSGPVRHVDARDATSAAALAGAAVTTRDGALGAASNADSAAVRAVVVREGDAAGAAAAARIGYSVVRSGAVVARDGDAAAAPVPAVPAPAHNGNSAAVRSGAVVVARAGDAVAAARAVGNKDSGPAVRVSHDIASEAARAGAGARNGRSLGAARNSSSVGADQVANNDSAKRKRSATPRGKLAEADALLENVAKHAAREEKKQHDRQRRSDGCE